MSDDDVTMVSQAVGADLIDPDDTEALTRALWHSAWGLFPLFFAAGGVSVGRIGGLIAVAPAVWGVGSCSPAPCRTRSAASG